MFFSLMKTQRTSQKRNWFMYLSVLSFARKWNKIDEVKNNLILGKLKEYLVNHQVLNIELEDDFITFLLITISA